MSINKEQNHKFAKIFVSRIVNFDFICRAEADSFASSWPRIERLQCVVSDGHELARPPHVHDHLYFIDSSPAHTRSHQRHIERGKDNIQQQLPIAPSSFDIIYFRMRVLAIKAELWAGKHIRESVAKQRLRGNLHNFCNLCLSVGRLC